ncbi:SA1362 family protein [Pontibacillus marinus]|uniref:SA1362 family protein n=1 Tax=Pontibacillus marinus TaxID=273164 RepID=UPI00040A6AAB|nr:SA1362 family protein [Pontibacillus marinus]
MFNRVAKPLIYAIVGLGIIGFGYKLFTDTSSLFTELLIGALVAVLIVGAVYFFLSRRNGGNSDEMKRYRQAVRQSKKKYGQTQSSKFSSKMKPSTIKSKVTTKQKQMKKDTPQLRVIEGNKSKKKNRASL